MTSSATRRHVPNLADLRDEVLQDIETDARRELAKRESQRRQARFEAHLQAHPELAETFEVPFEGRIFKNWEAMIRAQPVDEK